MTQKDKDIVRDLAKCYMEFATDEAQQKMNNRMLSTNDLKLVRPPVIIDEIPWQQMDIDNELTCLCEDPFARSVELDLRQRIYRRRHFFADTLFQPYYRILMAYDSTGMGIEKEEKTLARHEKSNIVSHKYMDILESEENVERIKIPTFTARPDKDEIALNRHADLLGDAMPIKLCGRGFFYHAPWDIITELRGLEPILYDLYDRPEYLHAIRRKFMEITMAEMDFVENHLSVDPNTPDLHSTPAYISGLAEDGLKATWLRAMAQGFSSVSPAMHEEFDIDYIIPLAKRFAYTYYGCCEPLDQKLDVIRKIPNLRKVGVTPWANEEVMAEQLRGDYVYARKPNPANVAIVTDPEVIRKETEQTVKLCQKYGCPVEFVLKDISTVSNRPENLIVWAKTVCDVLDEYYGRD